MGTIISSRVKDNGKIVFEISLDEKEALELKGNINNIHVFSENVVDVETKLAQRGRKEATKYFLIPRSLRKDINFKSKARCQRIDTATKTIFIYIIDKY